MFCNHYLGFEGNLKSCFLGDPYQILTKMQKKKLAKQAITSLKMVQIKNQAQILNALDELVKTNS